MSKLMPSSSSSSMSRPKSVRCPARPRVRAAIERACHEVLEERVLMSGGGWTSAGLHGEYFNGATLDSNGAPPAFTRRDVRLEFGQNLTTGPGGSRSTAYAGVPSTFWSARWTGQFVPKFTEQYTFNAVADDSLVVRVRQAGASDWTTVIDQASLTGQPSTGSVALEAGQKYDVVVSYAQLGGTWGLSLKWASPSTPEEVIEPLSQAGINNPDLSAGYTDLAKGARNNWAGINNAPSPAVDADGWPMGDGSLIWQESLNQGLDIDPLMRGRVDFSFKGSATVSMFGNFDPSTLTYSYDAASNTTSGSFVAKANHWNASYFTFTNSHRDGTATGPAGITDLKMMRPVAPDATTTYDPGELFTTNLKDAMSHFTLVRHQLVANQQREWSDRTLPSFFNQTAGRKTSPKLGVGGASNNGASWEYKVMLANETGRDMMISLPTAASGRTADDTTSYLYNLALLLKYGSDGVNPYTGPGGANPVPAGGAKYPGLNSNLNVYLELGNELWNFGGAFWNDYANLDKLTSNAADANDADFKAINFDNLSTAKDANGNYVSMGTWRYRMAMLRTVQASNIFRSVWGDAAMPGTSDDPRVRPLYEWQYDNLNDTARKALTWADKYFNNADGQAHVADARPVNYYLWGGGGAAYYGAANGNGLTSLLPNSGFDATAVATGYNQNPSGTSWSFQGTAGVARDGGTGDDIPSPFNGQQVGYVTDKGSMTTSFTVPASQTSGVYGVSFKAVNRTKTGATTADRQTLRAYLDYGTPNQQDITAITFSQPNGYTPPGYNPSAAWKAQNVSWMWSDYYFTKSFNVAPGSAHTVTIVGQGDVKNAAATDQVAFLEDVRVTSVDAIFASGIPGGGEAAGQPVGQNIQNVMNGEANWAKAYGLHGLSYESGWSLGGDDGGSWVQLMAKYGDPRTRDAQAKFMDMYEKAGVDVNVLGTYQQWPSWNEFYAEQGLLDVGRYPLVQGVDVRLNNLPVTPANGTPIPATIGKTAVSVADNADVANSKVNGAGGWMSYNVIAPYTGAYALTANTGAGGQVVLLADDAEVGRGASGTAVTGRVTLTKGLHAIKVRSVGGAFVVNSVVAASVSDVAAPTLTGVVQDGTSLTASWNPVPGAAGYVLRWGTARDNYTQRVDAGANLSATIDNLTAGGTYYVAVAAYGADGHESLPSDGRGVFVLPVGQQGKVVRYEFAGAVGNEPTGPVDATAGWLAATDMTRGPGLKPATVANAFASAAKDNYWGANLDGAIAKGQYCQFTIDPAAPAGTAAQLSSLSYMPFFQNSGGDQGTRGTAVAFSTDDGATFSPAIVASGRPGSFGSLYTVDLSSQAALQNVTGPLVVRVYLYGNNPYETAGIGSTAGEDFVITGSLRAATPANAAPQIGPAPAASTGGNPVTGTTVDLSVGATDDGGESNLTYTWAATAKPAGSNPAFSVNGTNTAKDATVTFDAAGTYTFTVTVADAANATASAQVTVVVGQTLTGLTLSPAAASAALGGTVQFSTTAADQFGAPMAAAGVTYDLSANSVGTINSATGLYNAPSTGAGGTATVTATVGGVTSGPATVSVASTAPVLGTAEAVPDAGGKTATLSAVATDDGGESNLTYTWALTGAAPAPVTFATNGTNAAKSTTATFTQAGTYTFTITVRDAGGLSTQSMASLTVSQALTTIKLTPGTANVAAGGTQAFTATAFDQFTAALSAQPQFAWNVSSGLGTISSVGLFTAPATAGTSVVTATAGGLSGSATVTTTVPAPTAPAAPTLLSVKAQGKNRARLTWRDNAANEKGFYIQQLVGSTWTTIATTGADAGSGTSDSFTAGGLTTGRTYQFRVLAFNDGGTSLASNVMSLVL